VATGHEWKDAVKAVDDKILKELAKVVCRQDACDNSDTENAGGCAFCADVSENVIGQYLILMGKL
jgi:hypothetical protein